MSLLTGLQILDLADEKASFCSKLLVDLGAEVIKIESPAGDASRWIGPFWKNIPHPERSLSFWYNNSNKLSITLNLEIEEGREIFRQLASKTDVVIETFLPGYLEKLKLDYGSLIEINPRLILALVTGFGQTGPYRRYKSCDIVASATGGQMYICGAPHTPPLKPYGEQSYFVASLFAAIGILIALRERNQSGEGQHIDISLQEAVAATLGHVFVRYCYDEVVSRRQGHYDRDGFLCLLPCQDGYILLTMEREWDILIGLLDSEGAAEDLKHEAWQDRQYRREHFAHIVEILSRWTKRHTREKLFLLGQLMRLPWAPVSSLPEVVNSVQLSERKFFVPVEPPELASEAGKNVVRSAPLIGEHNSQIYQERLGLSSEDLKRLYLKGHCQSPLSSFNKEGLKGSWGLRRFPFTLLTASAQRNDNWWNKPVTILGKTMNKDALQGIRILDFTLLLAGPYATRILADFGAEVIKVQSKKTASGAEDNTTGYFNAWNRGKLSIALNMSHPQARNIALGLVQISDVVIDNFTPRVMLNWGLNYDKLAEVKPDIIMLSMSAMGQTGPWRDFAALGHTIQAFSGITCLTSFPHEIVLPSSDGEEVSQSLPLGLGYPYADPVSGLFAVLAILAALEHRDKTGQGQHIDISEYEALCSSLGADILDYTVNGNVASPQGNSPGYSQAAPHGCYRCRGDDRWCVIAVSTEGEWQALCQVLGCPAWSKEKRFSHFSARKRHAPELDKLIEEWTTKYTPEEVTKQLQEAGIPAGIVEDAKDLANDPQLRARDFFLQIEHPILGKTISDNTPIKISGTPAKIRRAAPLLGQDNDYVYRRLLGMSEEELTQYVSEGVIY